jgi:hypothetical protein
VVGCCEHGNEPSGSIKGGEFFWLDERQLVKHYIKNSSIY